MAVRRLPGSANLAGMKVRGHAELTYEESAGLSFARAVERAGSDPSRDFPEAWVVDERRISFSLDADLAPAQLHAHRRLLEELVREASGGEVRLDDETSGRWDAFAGAALQSSQPRDMSGVVGADVDHPTIRTGTQST
jgi:hypothetical protein